MHDVMSDNFKNCIINHNLLLNIKLKKQPTFFNKYQEEDKHKGGISKLMQAKYQKAINENVMKWQ